MKKRYAIITDIHGNVEALESILNDIKKQNVDDIYCLGDTVGIGPNSKECIDMLIDNNIKSILGNHELYVLKGSQIDRSIVGSELEHNKWVEKSLTSKEIDYIKTNPLYYEINIDYDGKFNKKIILCHYLIKDPKLDDPFEKSKLHKEDYLWKKYNKEDVTYIVGHLHKIVDINSVPGISGDIILETGELTSIEVVPSAGCSHDEYVYYMIIDIDKSINYKLIKVKYDRNKFMNKIKNLDFPDKENILNIFYN